MPPHDVTEPLQTPFAHAVMVAVVGVLALPLLLQLRRIPPRLLVLMATAFVDMIGLLMLVPLMPFYVKKFAPDGIVAFGYHVAISEIVSYIVVSFTLAQSLSAPLWGRFSDRYGRRPALLVALAAAGAAYLVFG